MGHMSDVAWLESGLHAALDLPQTVALVGVAIESPTLLPSLVLPAHLRAASMKRKNDYLAGRHCAALALARSGCADVALLAASLVADSDGLPLWPSAYLGCITHSGGLALAAVAPRAKVRLLGIDAEVLIGAAAFDGIAALVASPAELDVLHGLTPAQRLTLLFSAKESLYKALYPSVRQFFDFDAVRVSACTVGSTAGMMAGSLRLTLCCDWHPDWRAGTTLSLRYALRGMHVYTALYLD